jgi:hypothetical protein
LYGPPSGWRTRSRKNEKFAGVENARPYVARKLWFGVGLNTSAARGENCAPAITLFPSTRAAASRSNFGARRVVVCR